MHTLPLISHDSLDKIIAWREDTAISVETFLADVDYLASILPSGKHILNLCRDRYHFTVGLAAAIISKKVSVLPPTHTPEMLRQLQAFAPDVFCLCDDDDCDITLARLNYPKTPYTKTLEHEATKASIPQVDAQQVVAIVFTSGSTGAPIPHSKSWGSLVKNIQAQIQRLGLLANGDYSIVGTIPPQHMYGLESTVLLPLLSGNALSNAQPFYPADIVSALESIPTPRILVSTPLHLRLLSDAEIKTPELTMTLSATAPLSLTLAHKVEASLDTRLIEIYGSTETGQIATRVTTAATAWHLLPSIELTERDENTWAEGGHIESAVPLNDIIELIDPHFFLLHGRTQDLINIAGKRSSLANLNHHLNAIEGVVDGAFFMPDELSHDHVTRLSACVVAPNLTSSSLLAELRLCIDPVFLPRPLLFVESLPRNSTGKLSREALKSIFSVSTNEETSCT